MYLVGSWNEHKSNNKFINQLEKLRDAPDAKNHSYSHLLSLSDDDFEEAKSVARATESQFAFTALKVVYLLKTLDKGANIDLEPMLETFVKDLDGEIYKIIEKEVREHWKWVPV